MSYARDDKQELLREGRARVAQIALRHWVGCDCDFRVGLLLRQAGLLREDIHPQGLAPEVVEALCNPQHSLRLSGPKGPLVFLKNSDNSHTPAALSVLDVLCAPDRDTRMAAVNHFDRDAKADTTSVTPFVANLLEEYGPDIRDTSPERWVIAAMRLEEELDKDFKTNLAGFRQGLHAEIPELIQRHWKNLLRPSVNSLLSVNEDEYELIKTPGAVAAIFKTMIDQAESLPDLLTEYEHRLGHLPLTAEMSIGAAACQWLKNPANQGSWGIIRGWEQHAPWSTRRLHACQIVLYDPKLLAKEDHASFWNDFTELMTLQTPDSSPEYYFQLFALEGDIASYFFQYLECRTVGMDIDRLASVSWWAASAVVEVILEYSVRKEQPAAVLEKIRRESVHIPLESCEREWQMLHPTSANSNIRYAMTFVPQARILGLLSTMNGRIAQLPVRALMPEQRHAITQTMDHFLLGMFPMYPEGPECVIWAFDRQIVPILREWNDAVFTGADVTTRNRLIDHIETFSDSNSVEDILEGIRGEPALAQAFLARSIHVIASTSSNGIEKIWKHFENRQWREDCFVNLEDIALNSIFLAMIELVHRVESKALPGFPHWFADLAEKAEESEDRRSLLFGMTVVASVATGTVSAVRRLAQGDIGQNSKERIANWREKAEGILSTAPTELAARLRDLLSSLRVS